MSTTYRVIAGDTFSSISRKQYGTEQEAGLVSSANPGVAEPLTAGTLLVIPVLANAPQNVQQTAPDTGENEVAVLINGQRFRFWGKVRVFRAVDSISTFELDAPFDSEAPGFRQTFRPFSYAPVTITVGGEPLFTGTMIGVDPVITTSRKILAVSGYGTPGVLNDCTPPASAFPLEFDGQGLQEIAATLAKPFGLSVEFQADQGAVFERVAIEPDTKILTFLAKLAKLRGLIMKDSPRGALVFLTSSDGGQPVARLRQGVAPVMTVTPSFNPQEYFSHISATEPAILGLAGSQYTVKNTSLTGVIRPLTFKAPDTLDADVRVAVLAKAARMFGNMAAYSVSVPTWRDPLGNLWTPNTTITLFAPDAMIYTEYEFLIRSIEFVRESNSETATLNVVIPGAFSGEQPETLPWDE